MPHVKVRIGDPLEKSLRILKKKLDKEGILKSAKNHRFYDKPSVKKELNPKQLKKEKKELK